MSKSIVNELKVGIRLSVEMQKVIDQTKSDKLTELQKFEIKTLASGPLAVNFFAPPSKCEDYYNDVFSRPIDEIREIFHPERIIKHFSDMGALTKREIKELRDYIKTI